MHCSCVRLVFKMEEKEFVNRDHSPTFAKYDESKILNDRKGRINENQAENNEPEYEELDPRVQDELEKLNQCTDKINDFELQLEEANAVFRTLLTGNYNFILKSGIAKQIQTYPNIVYILNYKNICHFRFNSST